MPPTPHSTSLGTKILLASVLVVFVGGVGAYFLIPSSVDTTSQVAVEDTGGPTEILPTSAPREQLNPNAIEDATAPTDEPNTVTDEVAPTTPTTPTTPPTPAPKEPAPAVVDNKKYKDGVYTAKGNYRSPEGNESVTVTLTIKNDIIVASEFSGTSRENTSQNYINRFAQGYKTEVVGKSVDAVKLGVVSGSSLTPMGFMNALANIKTQAQNS